MSEAKCKGGDCGEATYSTSKVEGAHYKADADTWRTDTPLFCSLECPRREALERALKGKPAESPAAPVERALAPGWSKWPGFGCNPCLVAGRADWRDVGAFARGIEGSRVGHCLPCAEAAGAFATPAPTVVLSPAGVKWFGRGIDAPEIKPAPKPAPRCEYRTADHEGTPVERVMFHGGAAKRMFACDACYLFSEGDFVTGAIYQRTPAVKPDNRPRAIVGVVPQVFGLSVGILSRGMAR